MSDILGPANATNAVTVRPTDGRSWSALDSWFRDCTSPSVDDGTEIRADWLNGITAALRALWRANGGKAADPTIKIVPETGNDDNGLVTSVQHLIQRGKTNFGVDVGTANSLNVTLAPAPAEYVMGMEIRVRVNVTNTGRSFFQANGLGFLEILDHRGAFMKGGELIAGDVVTLNFDGNYFRATGTDRVGSYFVSQSAGYGVAAGVETIIGNFALTESRIPNSTFGGGSTFYCGAGDQGVWLFTFGGNTSGDNQQTSEFAEILVNGVWIVRSADAGRADPLHDKSVTAFVKLNVGDVVQCGYFYDAGSATVLGRFSGTRIGG